MATSLSPWFFLRGGGRLNTGYEAKGSNTKEIYHSLLRHKTISFFYFSNPRSQVWTLIYRNSSWVYWIQHRPVSVQHQRLMWRVKLQTDAWNFVQKQLTRYDYLSTSTAYKDICLENIASSSVARDHFFSGVGRGADIWVNDKGNWNRREWWEGEKLLARAPPLFPSSPALAYRLSPVPRFKSPCFPLTLGKDRGGGRRENQLIIPRPGKKE